MFLYFETQQLSVRAAFVGLHGQQVRKGRNNGV